MKRLICPLIALVAIFALGAVTTLAITDYAEQRTIVRTQTTTSAATSITLFLVVTLLALGGLAAAVVSASYWLHRWGEREKMRKAMDQAQIYALLQGAQLPAPRRPTMSHHAGGGNTFVFPQQQTPQLPVVSDPNVGGWEVV